MDQTPLAMIDISALRRDGDVIPFDYDDSFGRPARGLLLRWGDEIYAYRNRCPHWSTPLDEYGDGLFDHGSRALICQTHGARFEPHNGECVSGPCFGESLEKLRVETTEDGQVAVYRIGLALGGP